MRLFIFLFTVGYLLLSPVFVFASAQDQFLLSQVKNWQILNSVQGYFTDQEIVDFVLLDGEEQAATFVLRKAIRKKFLEFLPGFVSTETMKVVLSVANQVTKISETSLKTLLQQIENFTVREAIKAGSNWLFQDEIKVASGNITDKKAGLEFQYVIAYKEIGHGKAEVGIEFYSSDSIVPPPPTASMSIGVPYFADELRGGRIRPFILRVNTQMQKVGLGLAIDPSASTKVTVEFPDKVPRLELAKELPYPIEEQRINLLNKFTAVKKVFDALGGAGIEFFNTLGKGVGFAREVTQDFFSFVSRVVALGGAGLIDPLAQEFQSFDAIEEQLNLVKDEAESVENLIPIEIKGEADILIDQDILSEIKEDSAPLETEVVLNEIKEELEPQKNQEKLNLVKEVCELDLLGPTALGDVILNEVAWMGTPISANDEWIELHNRSSAPINLEGWLLRDKGAQIDIVFDSSHVLSPNGFFLLERTDDTTVPDVPADYIYTGALSNKDEALYLFDQSCVLRDKVVADPDWPAGDNSNKKSMERNNHNLEWYIYDGQSFGSPRQTNGRDLLLGYTPLANVSFQAGITGGGVSPPSQTNTIEVCSQENLATPAYAPVIINEVAWMGTTGSANDEWLELKNLTQETVSLSGWQLLDKGEQIKIVFEDIDSIATDGMYLLERTDDTSVPEITADKIYSGSLNNSDETLRLFNQSCVLIDEVFANPNWLGGDNDTKKTLERKVDLSWQTYYGEGSTGTPKTENSVAPSPSPSPPPPVPPSSPPPEITTKTVVINEIAWMGTTVSANDEWAEFYNTTDGEIDLTGWKLQAEDGTPSIELIGTIVAKSYFLLERTDDTTVSDVAADFIYTGALENGGEVLHLYDAENNLIDKVDASSGWNAGDKTMKQTMERVDVTKEGTDSMNWANNNLITHNGKDTDGNYVNGTPRAQNSVSVSSTTISSLRLDEFDSVTLTKLGNPYFALSHIIVPAEKTLVIEPGVTLKSDGRLIVEGTLKAIGEVDDEIVFTNNTSGIWCGIHFTATSSNSELEYTRLKNASGAGTGCNAAVHYVVLVDGSSITMRSSAIDQGSNHRKLYLKNSNSLIDTITVSGATTNSSSAAVYINGGSPTVQNSSISNSSVGILSDGALSTPTIQNNTFTGNTYPVKLSSSGAMLSGNTATGNTYNGTFVEGLVYFTDVVWQADTMPYILNRFTVNEGKKLTIEAGVQVQFINVPYSGPELVVNGTLLIQGAADNLITFTKGPSLPYWKRIHFTSTSSGSILQYAQFSYGGSALGKIGVLYIEGNVDLQNVTIQNSPNVGIYSSGTITGSGITLADNAYAFRFNVAECPALTDVTISGSGKDFYPGSLECSF